MNGHQQQVNISTRLKLTDFIGSSLEETIINKISKIHGTLRYPFKLWLWYEKDKDIQHKELKRFMMEHESKLHYKTIITVGGKKNPNEFAWFDIINKNDKQENNSYRFQYKYEGHKALGILKGLDEFNECALFCTAPKPPKRKKQKRNDYEDEGRY
jgi:hypothetical protein